MSHSSHRKEIPNPKKKESTSCSKRNIYKNPCMEKGGNFLCVNKSTENNITDTREREKLLDDIRRCS
jgi:hypothetical protein